VDLNERGLLRVIRILLLAAPAHETTRKKTKSA
jgi:hypothetical protein